MTTFFKYQGTGNDFIIIDNRNLSLKQSGIDWVVKLCDRKFGIGADGLMLLQNKQGYDFEVVFYNPDGSQSLCGNGTRCMVAFAYKLGIIDKTTRFWAIDGEHKAIVLDPNLIRLLMNDVNDVELIQSDYFLNTGSPHYCTFVKDVLNVDVVEKGKAIRYNTRFKEKGTNVNFLEKINDSLFVRTYERGVENETLSCGTGVTAAALIARMAGKSTTNDYCLIQTKGGNLKVYFHFENNCFTDIWLEGPAELVYKGEIEI